MHGLSFLAVAVQEQVAVPPASVGNDDGRMYLWIALGVGVLALVAALLLARAVIASDTGTAEMQAISNAIREGAEAFLRRQYRTIGAIALVLAVVVFVGYHMSPRTAPLALKTVMSFLVGAVCSGLAGFTGMYCSIRANIRTASAARTSLNEALQMALRGGAVTGLGGGGAVAAGSGVAVPVLRRAGESAGWCRTSWLGLDLALRWWRCLRSLAEEFIRRPRTWARTWWARLRRGFRRTIRAIRR